MFGFVIVNGLISESSGFLFSKIVLTENDDQGFEYCLLKKHMFFDM